jgi:hypothetical protein
MSDTLKLPPGSDCYVDDECQDGFVCVTDLVELSMTGQNPAPNCQPMPAIGESCAQRWGQETRVCPEGAFCDASDTCEALPAIDAPCAIAFGQTEARVCESGLCVDGTCRRLPRQGESCESPSADPREGYPCADAFACACADPACTIGVCSAVLAEGDACGAAATVCERATSCVGGSCVYMGEPQRLFETACGG